MHASDYGRRRIFCTAAAVTIVQMNDRQSISDYRLPRSERLRSLGAVRRLFTEGKGGFVYPFRFVYRVEGPAAEAEREDGTDTACAAAGAEPSSECPSGSIEVLFSVPKKFHKRANRRNLLKRRMREAYRLQKGLLGCDGVDFLLAWSSKEVGDWPTVRDEVATALARIDKAVARQRGAVSSSDGARSAAEQPSGEPDEAAAHNDSGK